MRALSGSKRAFDISFIGRHEILASKKLALFCSVQCPGSLIIKAHDLAQALRHSDLAVVSGFQSPVEQECFTILLRGPAPVILCPARSIGRITIRPEWREAIESGRLLVLSSFPEHQRRPTVQLAAERNRVVATLADAVFVAHAAPSSKTVALCQENCVGGKAVFTFDDPANAELLALGARAATPQTLLAGLSAGTNETMKQRKREHIVLSIRYNR